MSDDVVTYADVARWLPQWVRDDIAKTTPCVNGAAHAWEHCAIDVRTMDSMFPQLIESWRCLAPGCNRSVSTDPAER